jgi:hypothetical protein
MSDEKEIQKLADEIYKYGTVWLTNAKEIADAIPFVYRAVQTSLQFSQSFQSAPAIAGMPEIRPLRAALEQTQVLFSSDPLKISEGTFSAAVSGAAIISAAGTHATSMMSAATHSADPTLQSWATQNVILFEKLQTTDDNVAFIKRKLVTLYAGSDLEFQQAKEEYFKALAGAIAASGAAIAMRNVMETLNGNILEFARKHSKGGIKTWIDAAAVIARGAPGSMQTTQLSLQKAVYDDLHDKKLTPAAKNDWQPSKTDLEAVYAQFIGFLFTVLGLIDFKDGS